MGEGFLEGAEERDVGVLVSALSWHLSGAQWDVRSLRETLGSALCPAKTKTGSTEVFCVSPPDNSIFIFKGFSFSLF